VRKIPSTNLVFLAVETPCKCNEPSGASSFVVGADGTRRRGGGAGQQGGLTAVPRELEELRNRTGEAQCKWLNRLLFRRRPSDCTNYHPEVSLTFTPLFLLPSVVALSSH
jgi:hypothetical protein